MLLATVLPSSPAGSGNSSGLPEESLKTLGWWPQFVWGVEIRWKTNTQDWGVLVSLWHLKEHFWYSLRFCAVIKPSFCALCPVESSRQLLLHLRSNCESPNAASGRFSICTHHMGATQEGRNGNPGPAAPGNERSRFSSIVTKTFSFLFSQLFRLIWWRWERGRGAHLMWLSLNWGWQEFILSWSNFYQYLVLSMLNRIRNKGSRA